MVTGGEPGSVVTVFPPMTVCCEVPPRAILHGVGPRPAAAAAFAHQAEVGAVEVIGGLEAVELRDGRSGGNAGVDRGQRIVDRQIFGQPQVAEAVEKIEAILRVAAIIHAAQVADGTDSRPLQAAAFVDRDLAAGRAIGRRRRRIGRIGQDVRILLAGGGVEERPGENRAAARRLVVAGIRRGEPEIVALDPRRGADPIANYRPDARSHRAIDGVAAEQR